MLFVVVGGRSCVVVVVGGRSCGVVLERGRQKGRDTTQQGKESGSRGTRVGEGRLWAEVSAIGSAD